MKEKHMWTANEIKKLITMWESKTLEELCREFGLSKPQLTGMRNAIKKEGYTLVNKRKVGTTRLLINEVLSNMGLKK